MLISKKIEITFTDWPDNHSHAGIIYFTGCEHNCQECHNPEFKIYELNNNLMEVEFYELMKIIIEKLRNNETNKLILSGGDPLYKKNIESTKKIISYCNINNIDVCVYTGYDIEFVNKNIDGFAYVKCGKFDHTKKLASLKTDKIFRLASYNQDFYDHNYKKLSKNGILKFKGIFSQFFL